MIDVDHGVVLRMVQAELSDDIGSGDIHAGLCAEKHTSTAVVKVRERAVLCGQAWFECAFNRLSDQVAIHWHKQEGQWCLPEEDIVSITGPTRALLTGERTALNFLQTLSSTATMTAKVVEKVGDKCQVLDTRKTLPLWRHAQKYAVRCGGGTNHRFGLYDAFLLKENHIMAAGGIGQAVAACRRIDANKLCQVEVESLAELAQAVAAGADMVLLDNFTMSMLHEAVSGYGDQIVLEASGNITEDNMLEISQVGVARISLGSLTKHIKAIDFSMRLLEL